MGNWDYGVILAYAIEDIQTAFSDANKDEDGVLDLDKCMKSLDVALDLVSKYKTLPDNRFDDFLREFQRSVRRGNETLFIENWSGSSYGELIEQLNCLQVPKVAILKSEKNDNIVEAFTSAKWREGDEGKAVNWLGLETDVVYFKNPLAKR